MDGDGDGRENGQPGDEAPATGQQRRPSRADSLRLTRMPQISGQRTTRTGTYPVVGDRPSAPAGSPSPSSSAASSPPEMVAGGPGGSGKRRWGLIAAGVAVALAVPIGLVAAGSGWDWKGKAAGEKAAGEAGAFEVSTGPEGVPGVSTSAVAPGAVASGGPVPPAAGEPAPSASATGPSAVKATGPSAVKTAEPTTAPAPAGRANPSGTNLALRAAVTASDSEGDRWLPRYACDGDPSSRWSSGFTDSQWLKVDLRANWKLSQIVLNWEHAHAVAYRVETSLDGRAWTRVYSTDAGRGGTVKVSLADTVARYVRMTGIKRSNQYGYSLYEFEVR